MEKKVAILLTAMTIIINIFLYIYINQHMIDKLLYDKTTVSFKIYDKDIKIGDIKIENYRINPNFSKEEFILEE